MSDFYTRSGDDGTTGLLGAGRVLKFHPVTEAIGALDEATAALGVARANSGDDISDVLLHVQRDLYHVMAEVAATPENAGRFRKVDQVRVAYLEYQIDEFAKGVKIPNEFILPGDSPIGAFFAVARTVVRRAERQVARLVHSGEVENPHLLSYLNRLSSLCFVLELDANQDYGVKNPTLAKK